MRKLTLKTQINPALFKAVLGTKKEGINDIGKSETQNITLAFLCLKLLLEVLPYHQNSKQMFLFPDVH